MLTLLLLLPSALSAAAAKPARAPNRLAVVDSIVQEAIHAGQIPGAVVLVWHNGQVLYRKAFGYRALEPRRELMTVDTVFDLASLTKVVATTTAVMQLVEKGEVRLNDPVAKYIPEFAQNGKEDITVRGLLTHYSGCAGRACIKSRAGQILCSKYFYAAEDGPHAIPSTGDLGAEDCSDRIRRAEPDAAWSCARSLGASHGWCCRTGRSVFHRGRPFKVCPCSNRGQLVAAIAPG